MPTSHAQAFIDALTTLERDGDSAPLADLYAKDGTSANLTGTGDFRGPDGARAFWTEDQKLFQSIGSEFRSIVEDGDTVALEWRRTGVARDGGSVSYDGMSLIEFDDGKITRFCGYYDPATLGHQTV